MRLSWKYFQLAGFGVMLAASGCGDSSGGGGNISIDTSRAQQPTSPAEANEQIGAALGDVGDVSSLGGEFLDQALGSAFGGGSSTDGDFDSFATARDFVVNSLLPTATQSESFSENCAGGGRIDFTAKASVNEQNFELNDLTFKANFKDCVEGESRTNGTVQIDMDTDGFDFTSVDPENPNPNFEFNMTVDMALVEEYFGTGGDVVETEKVDAEIQVAFTNDQLRMELNGTVELQSSDPATSCLEGVYVISTEQALVYDLLTASCPTQGELDVNGATFVFNNDGSVDVTAGGETQMIDDCTQLEEPLCQ